MWTKRVPTVIVFSLGVLLSSPPATVAERNALQMSPPSARPETAERDLYPHRPATPHARAFVWPLTKKTESGQAGAALWTAPNVPSGSRGAGDPDNSGWLGFGFAAEWGRPSGDRVRN